MSPIRSWPNSACVGMPNTVTGEALLFHQRTLALIQGAECLVRGDRRAQLVVIPWPLRLRRLLDLVEIHRVGLAAVRAHRALAEERIVGRHLLHLGDHLRAVVRLELLD